MVNGFGAGRGKKIQPSGQTSNEKTSPRGERVRKTGTGRAFRKSFPDRVLGTPGCEDKNTDASLDERHKASGSMMDSKITSRRKIRGFRGTGGKIS